MGERPPLHIGLADFMLKSGLALILLGIAQFLIPAPAGIDTWLCRWSGLSWIAAGLAYFAGFSSIFGKRPTGNLQALHAILMAPYLVVTWILWFLQTRLSREPVCNEVAPGVIPTDVSRHWTLVFRTTPHSVRLSS